MRNRNEFILELIEQAKRESVKNGNDNLPPMGEQERKDTLQFLNQLEEEKDLEI